MCNKLVQKGISKYIEEMPLFLNVLHQDAHGLYNLNIDLYVIKHQEPRKIFLQDIFLYEHLEVASPSTFLAEDQKFRQIPHIFDNVDMIELSQELHISKPYD